MATPYLNNTVIQSPNDRRQYKVVVLPNGLRALLISDLNSDPETSKSGSSDEVKPNQLHPEHVHKKTAQDVDDYSSLSEEDEDESESEDTEDDASDMEVDCETGSRPSIKAAGNKKQKCDEDTEKLAAASLCIGVGSFSDPPELPGLAHFLEHMVFMGSKKYPDENAFDSFIKKNGGNANAFTDCERTCFFFDVQKKSFKEALDRFAQFFIHPLLKQDSVDRELNAVESEFSMSKSSDHARKQQLLGSLAKNGVPMAKFMWGNDESLKQMPFSQQVDLYSNLKLFHSKYYTAHLMTLAVQAKESLETLEMWTKEIFSEIPNNDMKQPCFQDVKGTFDTKAFTRMYEVVPVKNQHILELTWHLPCMKHLYRSKPIQHVGWLLGHEGKGSIVSCLRKSLWAVGIASGNSESGWEHNTTGALFTVQITLTDKGLSNIFEVMSVVFEYIEMLRKNGPEQRIYDELKVIEDNEFRWKEQVDPIDYVEHVSEAMQMFPPPHYLCGDTLLFEYNPEAIRDVLNNLNINNVNAMILSNSFDEPDKQYKEEYWYKTKYNVKDIPVEWIKRWGKLTPRAELFLPADNEYIPTDFSLKDRIDEYTKEPKLVLKSPYSRLFFKQDKKFKVPRGYLYFYVMSPVVANSARSLALFDLFVDVLTHNLQEVAYSAHVAQLGYEFKANNSGLIIKINGFNHKLSKLFETIIDHIADFDVTDDLFHTINEQLMKKYWNDSIKSEKLAKDVRLMVLKDKSWTRVHRGAFLHSVNKADLMAFVAEFKKMNFIHGYVHGNYTLQEAMDMECYIRRRLCGGVLPQSMLPLDRVVDIPRSDCLVRVKSLHENDSNSCVFNYYQAGPCNMRQYVTNELVNMMMDEPCFDILRTREQLGYIVFSSANSLHGIVGICVVVCSQAENFSVKQVDATIEQFLNEFKARLNSCSDKDFDGQRHSLIALKQCDDSHMGEEADRLWNEIRDGTYLFDRLDKEIDELENLTIQDVRSWFCDLFDSSSDSHRKKLSVQVVGSGEKETDGLHIPNSEVYYSAPHLIPVDISHCTVLPRYENGCVDKVDAKGENFSSLDLKYLEVEKKAEDSHVVIQDVALFKNRLPLYPVSFIK